MTLIELMISLALGLLVITAATSVFLASREANRDTESLSRIQENARIAFDFMYRSLRELGNIPCGTDAKNVFSYSVSGSGWYALTLPEDAKYEEYEKLVLKGKTDAGIDGASGKIQKLDGRDYTVEYAAGGGDSLRFLTLASDTGSGGISSIIDERDGKFVLQSVIGFDPSGIFLACDQSTLRIFTGGTFAASPTATMPKRGMFFSPNLKLEDMSTTVAYLAMLHPEAWFIGRNERGGTSLYRATGNAHVDEIVPDATVMKLSYLIPGKPEYVDASKIPEDKDGWPKVVAVRIALTLRSDSTRPTSAPGVIERTLVHTVTFRNRQPVLLDESSP
jgi:type IV pilus assembly protein PilW